MSPLQALADAWNITPNPTCINKIIELINEKIAAWEAPDMHGEPLRTPMDMFISVKIYLVQDHLRSFGPLDIISAFAMFKQLGWNITAGFDREVKGEDGHYYQFSYEAYS